MALAYDFDIFEVIPSTGTTDPQLDGFLSDVGFSSSRESRHVALFRDLRTADALRRAPAGLRAYFQDSGFGLNTYNSGAPRGRYPARDEAARLDLIRRLTENAAHHLLPRADDSAENGDSFSLGVFLAELDKAEPITMAAEELKAPGSEVVAPVLLREPTMSPIFDSDPIPDQDQKASEPPPQRRAFWNSRFLRFGAAAALVFAAFELASGPAATVLASL